MSRPVHRAARLLAALVALVAVPVVVAQPAHALSQCQESAPDGAAWSVTVCLETPAPGSTLTGEVRVAAGVTRTGTAPSSTERVVFTLRGGYLLTAVEATVGHLSSSYARFDLVLPSAEFVDGAAQLSVSAVMANGFETLPAGADVTLANGITSPPAPAGSWAPRGAPAVADRPYVVAAVGNGAVGRAKARQVSDLVTGWAPDAALYLGDVYERGTRTEYRNHYGSPTELWGRLAGVTNPVIGNHEAAGDGHADYWGNAPSYYSWDVAGWHIVALDSTDELSQLMPGSAQYEWLRNDLATSTSACTMAFFHHPRWSVGTVGGPALQDIWALLADRGVDLVLNAHDHSYQRWTPMDRDGVPAAGGPTQLVAGTGGQSLGTFSRTDARLVTAMDATASPQPYGALRLGLTSSAASYEFVDVVGTTRDQGTLTCSPHIPPPPASPTVLFADGFESGSMTGWTTAVGVVAGRDTAYSGAWAARATSVSGATRATYARRSIATRDEVVVRARVRVISQGATSACLLKVRHATNMIADLCVDADGGVYSWNYVTATKRKSTVKLLPGTAWRAAELRVRVDRSGGPGELEAWLDGVRLPELSGPTALGTAPIASVQIGGNESSKVYDLAFDNVTISAGNVAPPPPPPAAPLFSDGFESGTLSAWSSVSGLSVSSVRYTGGYGARATSTSSATYARRTLPSPQTELFFRARVNVLSRGASNACLLKVRAGSTMLVDLCVDSAGALYSWNYGTSTKRTSTTKLVSGSGWHTVQLRVVVAGEASRTEVWADGAQVAALTTTQSLGTAAATGVQLGGNESGKTYDIAFDEVAVATTYISGPTT
jgi:hypothetical protein